MEELRADIKTWIMTKHYNFTLPDWVDENKFFNDLTDKVIEDIKKTGINEDSIYVSNNILAPLLSVNINIKENESFIYKFPDNLLGVVNSIRKPYRIVYLD